MEIIIQLKEKKKVEKYQKVMLKACEKTLSFMGKKEKSCSILLTDDKQIQKLNKKFLKADRATDVIAFPSGEKNSSYLGDIAISLPKAKGQAKIYKEKPGNELARLVIHGVLHLLGENDTTYGAKKRMWGKQEKILALLKTEAK